MVQIDNLPEESDLQLFHFFQSELLYEGSQLRAQIQIGADLFNGSRIQGRHVDRIANFATAHGRRDRFRDFYADAFLSFLSRGAQVGSQIDLRMGTHGVVRGGRLAFIYVQTGCCDLATVQRIEQSGLLDDTSTGAIENAYAILHLREGGLIDHVFRLIG